MQIMAKQTLNHQVSECHSTQKMPMFASFFLKPGIGLLILIYLSIYICVYMYIYLSIKNKYGFMAERLEGLIGHNRLFAFLLAWQSLPSNFFF
jgi:hypothetical protein